ncbi:TPA_asm: hypothetical protein [Porphyromonas phage phage011a_WW2952]|uniref:Uncharacterized protein n=1 Tax=Porphyromonas phage phage011a_WW2952 TaxID=3154101 RepID=A0AAT9JI24_9CAUD|nr:hypothetical protein [Porphyromonas gingivalis]PDP74385.1 hypothetical protein CLI79_09785 [Porphyromonas gingivalis]
MKTRENKGRIEVQKGGGERDYLCKLFRVTPQMVWKALSFESDTDLAKKIRKAAMERGAQHVVELPIFETIHDAEGRMTQTFPGGAIMVCYKDTGAVEVYHAGELVERYEDVSIAQLDSIQQMCATIKI